ncbi:MAG: rod shape-determining protein MreD [Rhizobiales bacterium TMED249]|uniref:Rod shape-determining protein MreD n=1 Tax=PS1 clade bacterium TaxID=2175152 RepID=A0A368DUJ7_9PROT|nr:MAG: rod shape-determining protein MreD [Rhizobiales bacterium TMED249]RCL75489.1 MAG: rod shape-determining protein MreD [PS1 clade bacterium]HAK97709.1 rod shape-determining protein MreD [Rhodobiaceae bacterium]HCV49150.1 rod shape-determining protein MreD [Rhodobiaceae bacterium]|tara:strand:- start:633 stop:1184 length:552 start_codon:yes stop_codon:yes gene_type:complete
MAFSDKNFRQTIGRPQESNRLFPSVLPIIIAVLSILIPKVPVGHLFDVVPAPGLILIVIFFWSLVDPDRFSIYLIFFLGLLEDILTGTPLGMWSLILILLHYFVASQGTTLLTRGKITKWAVFSLFSLFSYLLAYFLIWQVHGSVPAFKVILVPFILTVICFIPFYRLFEMTENMISSSAARR